jgi:preprotein translocase subunit SecA
LIENRVADVVAEHVGLGYAEEWDYNALALALLSTYPTQLSADELRNYTDAEEIGAIAVDEAVSGYEKKAENFPGGLETAKEIERDVMLQILDQRWRDHLADMDYLRDGIHLRQTAQQDPLNAWQKEGYLMFEHLLEAVDADYVRYITHVEATAAPDESESGVDEGLAGALTNVNEVAPGATELPAHSTPGASQSTPRATAHEKIGRNDPCWCGSGRKFKQCHGRP